MYYGKYEHKFGITKILREYNNREFDSVGLSWDSNEWWELTLSKSKN